MEQQATTSTRSASLPAAATSAPEARRLVEAALHRTPFWPRAEDAALAVSELVTNAVLHGREPIELTLVLSPEELLVEVRDGSAVSPAFSMLDPTAVTGRGLLLVSAFSDSWGVEPETDGKVVWFRMSLQPAARGDVDETERLLASWADELDVDPAAEKVRVVITDLDSQAMALSEAHTEGVLRELALLSGSADDDGRHRAASLLEAAVHLDALRAEVRRQVALAVHHHHPTLDVTLTVRREDAEQVRDFLHALEEADRLTQRGELLMVAAPLSVAEVRRVFLGRLLNQLRSY